MPKRDKKDKKHKNDQNISENKPDTVTTTGSYNKLYKTSKIAPHNFWGKMPVNKFDLYDFKNENIIQNHDEFVSKIKMKLPNAYTLEVVENISGKLEVVDIAKLQKVVDFLNKHHFVDDTEQFREITTVEKLKWNLRNGSILIISSTKTGDIIGTIGGKIVRLNVFAKEVDFCNTMYFCVDPNYRKKYLSIFLMTEMMHYSEKVFCIKQGYFITDKCVPKPSCTIRFYSRPINYLKLEKTGYLDIGGNAENIQRKIEKDIPKISTTITNLTIDSLDVAYKIYMNSLDKLNVSHILSQSEFSALFFDEAGTKFDFVDGYLISDKNGNVLDVFGLFSGQVTLSKSDTDGNIHEEIINNKNLFLHTANSGDVVNASLLKSIELQTDILILSDNASIGKSLMLKEYELDEESDVEDYEHVYATTVIKTHKLAYINFYNWKAPDFSPKQSGLFITN